MTFDEKEFTRSLFDIDVSHAIAPQRGYGLIVEDNGPEDDEVVPASERTSAASTEGRNFFLTGERDLARG